MEGSSGEGDFSQPAGSVRGCTGSVYCLGEVGYQGGK